MYQYLFTRFADSCAHGDFLGFPTWYKYLPGATDPNTGVCSPQLTSLSDVYLIGAAVIEILLRLAGLVAVGFIIYGGITYATSQGEPDKTAKAKTTIISALAGLVLAVMAAALVSFIARNIA